MAHKLRFSLLALLLALGCVEAWPEISGSCIGPASEHIPADHGAGYGNAGRYAITIDRIQQGGTVCDQSAVGCTLNRSGRMNIIVKDGGQDPGCWSGILIKALDAATGLPLPAFATTSLGPGLGLFDGCSDRRSAVTHTSEFGWCTPFSLDITWPANKDIAIQAFVVSDETEWYEVYGSSTAKFVHAQVDCPRQRLSVASIIIGFAPIVIIFIAASLLRHVPGLRGLKNMLDQTGSNKTVPVHSPILGLITFDVAPCAAEMSLGEWLCFVLFFACEIASLIVAALFVAQGAPVAQSEEENVTLSPWDASAARAFGHLLMINMANTMFLPTRNSVLAAFSGISYERMVRYHRVVGRFAFFLMIIHGALHIKYWGIADCFSTYPICFGVNKLWGSLSGILLLVAFAGTLDIVRRKFFEIFLFSHLLVFPATAMACVHATDFIYFLIAPLALYSIDMLLRMAQTMRKSTVVKAQSMEGGVLKLEIECPSIARALYDKKERALGAFVCVRAWKASWNPIDLHPFTVSGLMMQHDTQEGVVSTQNGAGGTSAEGITLHIKSVAAGQWTDRLLKAAQAGEKLTVGLEGPYGELSINIKAYTTIVCVAGGIGITPFAHLLEMFINRKDECFPNVQKLVIVWSVQKMVQTACFAGLLEEADKWKGNASLEVLVHATREGKEREMRVVKEQSVVLRDYGRPDIRGILGRVAEGGQNKVCCAMGCGPPALITDLRALGRELGVHTHFETFLY